MPNKNKSLDEVNASVKTNFKNPFKKFFAFAGPAYLISVGYMDPGNWATDIAGGSGFGYSLLWVLLMSNVIAILLQNHSARLGIVSGLDLAQANRAHFPAVINFILYVYAEVAIVACDLAEVLGMAIGIHLLFPNIPLLSAVLITVLDSFLLLFLMNKGIRRMEAFIITLISIIGLCFFIEMLIVKPVIQDVAKGFVPFIANEDALYIAIGIIGATVMPHNLYLHSSLVQSRAFDRKKKDIKSAIRYNFYDSIIALNMAFFVNAAILILAAASFFHNNIYNVTTLQHAHQLLSDILGNSLAPILFAIALIAAGQSSTITGTLAGQVVMEGYLNLRLQPWVRRLITRLLAILPAVLTIMFFGESKVSNLLILSQVVLSLQLGFAVVPLIHFVSSKKIMGHYAIPVWQKIISWLAAGIILFLNIKMVVNELIRFLSNPEYSFVHGLIVIPLFVLSIGLLLYIIFVPIVFKQFKIHQSIHGSLKTLELQETSHLKYKNIAITLDFSDSDNKAINHAISLADKGTKVILIHVLESIGAMVYKEAAEDSELKFDTRQIEHYCTQVKTLHIDCVYVMGFGSPKTEIPRIVREYSADILIMGAHGHKTIKDILLGATIESVRHQIEVPLLIV